MTVNSESHELAAYSISVTREKLGNLSRQALWRLMKTGQLDARKIGRRTVFLADSVNNFLANLPKA